MILQREGGEGNQGGHEASLSPRPPRATESPSWQLNMAKSRSWSWSERTTMLKDITTDSLDRLRVHLGRLPQLGTACGEQGA